MKIIHDRYMAMLWYIMNKNEFQEQKPSDHTYFGIRNSGKNIF